MAGAITARIRSALTDGGPRELLRRVLAKGARALESSPAPPSRTQPSTVAPTHIPPAAGMSGATAIDVGFAEATRFFQRRQANYEQLADAIAPHLPADGVLFDIGANIGYFSKVVGERTKFHGSAHLFEPIPHLAQFCFQSLAAAEFAYSVHLFGLGDTDGHLDIFIDPKGNFGWNTMVEGRARDMIPQRVAVRRFDGIGLTVMPSVIKIDVEGAEYLVLRGLLPSIRAWSSRPPILCEIGWGAAGHPNWQEELAVFAELAALGYRATSLHGEPVDITTIDKTSDVLFLPG